MALIFQNVIVPNISSLNGEGKLLPNDAIYFDTLAWGLAEEIRAQGWGEWKVFVANDAPGNVAILGALYALFGHDPSLIVPLNSSLHAGAGVLIFLLSKELALNSRVGIFTGLFASTLFVIFPSALIWYGQVHKDGYAIVGTLLLLLIWVRIIENHKRPWIWIWVIGGGSLASILVGMVRPYGLTLLFVVSIGAFLLVFVCGILKYKVKDFIQQSLMGLSIVVILLTGIVLLQEQSEQQIKLEVDENVNEISQSFQVSPKIDCFNDSKKIKPELIDNRQAEILNTTDVSLNNQVLSWHWRSSEWIPDVINGYIAGAAITRHGFIEYGIKVKAGSTIDANEIPQNISEFILYLPRALQIAALAPFPSMWFSHSSVMRLMATVEMFIYYLCISGFLFLFSHNRKPAIWLTLYFSITFLIILGFTIPNLGTLYRLRYAYFFILLMLGVMGWGSFLEKKGLLKKFVQHLLAKPDLSLQDALSETNISKNRKQAMGSGIYVMGLTLIAFIGFFYRDILMAHSFGLGTELDGFFVALLILMTIVSIVCMPLGTAFTPIFLEVREKGNINGVQKLISTVSGVVTLMLFCICFALYFLIPYLLTYMFGESAYDNLEKVQELTLLAMPILFFSGSVVLGNAVLNAIGRVVVTGMAQLIVPVVAILAVVFYGKYYGVHAVIVGMVIGQLINLWIVQVYIKKSGYSLKPRFSFSNDIHFSQLISQYFPLVASAFFISVGILVNTMLAMSLPEGNVSVFNLGSKIVLLITGLFSVAVSSVMLPYFSTLVAKNNVIAARRELSVFLLYITFFSVPISVVFFVWAEQIVEIIFFGGNFESSDVNMVVRVMQYAVIQIPFFACNMLLLKFATATRHVVAILLIATLGLLINVAASLLLMKYIGVAGIALGASLSMAASTVFLVMILVKYQHIGLFDMVVLFLNWLLFITLLMSVNFKSVPGIVVISLAYFILIIGYRNLFSKDFAGIRKDIDNVVF